jgi:hypothetical protein
VPVSSRAALVEALVTGAPDRIFGTPESAWLDFKRDLYDLRSNSGKWEFLKDVVSLANAQGGVLLIGVKAAREAHEPAELASELWPIPRLIIDVDQLKQIARDLVQPPLVLDVRAYAHPGAVPHDRAGGSEELCYLVIDVASLPELERYAVIRRTLSSDGKLIEGIAAPVRHDDGTRWLSADEL